MIELTLQEGRDIEKTIEDLLDEIEEAELGEENIFVSYAKEDGYKILELVRQHSVNEEQKFWEAVNGE